MDQRPVRLEVIAGNAAGMSILVEHELVIGRHVEGAGRLADDDEISRSHARVSQDPSGSWAVEDLGSTNGTFVNGRGIGGPHTLSDGDTIEVGGTTLVVRDLPSHVPEETPAAGARLQPTVVPVGRQASGQPARDQEPPAPPVEDQQPAAHMPPTLAEPDAPQTLEVRLEVDFAAREARIALNDASASVLLRFEAGAWRAAPPTP